MFLVLTDIAKALSKTNRRSTAPPVGAPALSLYPGPGPRLWFLSGVCTPAGTRHISSSGKRLAGAGRAGCHRGGVGCCPLHRARGSHLSQTLSNPWRPLGPARSLRALDLRPPHQDPLLSMSLSGSCTGPPRDPLQTTARLTPTHTDSTWPWPLSGK